MQPGGSLLFTHLRRSGMLLGAAAEGAAPDVVPQLLDQLRVLLLNLLRELLPSENEKKETSSPTVHTDE